MEERRYLKIGEAAAMIGCSCQTLRNYHKKGIVVPELVFETGHRRYSMEQVEQFICGKGNRYPAGAASTLPDGGSPAQRGDF